MSEDDTTTHIRIRKTTLKDIELILDRNPSFDSHASIVDFAITELKRKLIKK